MEIDKRLNLLFIFQKYSHKNSLVYYKYETCRKIHAFIFARSGDNRLSADFLVW